MQRPFTPPAQSKPDSTFSRRQALGFIGGGLAGLSLYSAPEALANIRTKSGVRGFDRSRLENAATKAKGFDQLHSLIIARDGEIAFAEAFRGPKLDRAVNVKSVSKSFVAALAGAAIDRKFLTGTDQPIGEIASGLIPRNADPRVRTLTVADFLTMQAGLERTSGPNYGRWVQSRNWVSYALSRDFVAEPGKRMLYSTGSYHVLGAVLTKVTGKTLLTLAREWIGDTLNIAIPAWKRDPQGYYFGGNDMMLSPISLFRFAEMHRLDGVLDGKRVLSGEWIEAAWTPRTRSPFSGDQYGYGWFISSVAGRRLVYARGYGGQMIYIVPSLDLTVVITSDPNRPARSHGYAGDLRDLLANDILPAMV